MPIVTPRGGEILNWDITYTKHDPKTGHAIEYGNGFKELVLTGGTGFDYEPNGQQYHEVIWRGQPDPVKMCWNELPVYRVLTHRFKSGHEWIENESERLKTDWGRFARDFQKDVEGRLPSKVFFYEPHILDIKKDQDNPYCFPLWFIEKLVEWGEFENALKTNKVNLPSHPRLTKGEYSRIMKAIEERREQENGNVSADIKQSKKPAKAARPVIGSNSGK